MIYWFARPSEHHPTVEFRVADTNADLDTTVLVALLLRGLCATLLAQAEERRPPPDAPVPRLRDAHRYAAQYGPTGLALDPFTGERVPARSLITALVAAAAPGLRAAGDEAEVHRLLGALLRKGTGAARQRAAPAPLRRSRSARRGRPPGRPHHLGLIPPSSPAGSERCGVQVSVYWTAATTAACALGSAIRTQRV
ncbi:hypothetical protein GCM10020254_08020 [Streptomyces goshikiensis]